HRRHHSLCRRGRKSVSRYSGYAVHVSNYLTQQRFWRHGAETVGHAKSSNEKLSASRSTKTVGYPGHTNVSDHARSTAWLRQFSVEFHYCLDRRSGTHP